MKAISTKYLSATTYRGSRVKAFDCDGNSVIVSYEIPPDSPENVSERMPPWEFSHNELYYRAAYALCDKMKWTDYGELTGGGTRGGMEFVFVNPYHRYSTCVIEFDSPEDKDNFAKWANRQKGATTDGYPVQVRGVDMSIALSAVQRAKKVS